MSTRSRRIRTSLNDVSPPRTRKGVSPTRSPARTRKSSPPKRTTSPARKSPSRKSPSRKPASQYPARKSPSRATAKETIEVTQKSPAKRPAIKTSARELSVQLDNLSSKLEIFRSTRSKRLEYTIKDVTSSITPSEFSLENVNGLETFNDSYGLRIRKPLEKDNIEELVPRRSSRLRDTENVPDTRRSLSKSVSKSISKSIDTFSDGENSDDELVREKSKSQSVTRKLATPLRSSIGNFVQVTDRWEFGGRIGSALLIFVIPLTVFTLLISCMNSCSHKAVLNLSTYKSLSQWFSLQAFLFVIVQLITQAVFAVLPILGTKADRMDESGTKYCFNAFFSSIFTIHLLFILDFWQIIDKDALINDYLKLAVVSYIFAVILSIVAYVKSRKIDVYELNPYGNTGYVLYDFFMGREIHPHVMGLDIKVWISRISNINALILSALIFQRGLDLPLNDNDIISFGNYKELLNKVQLQPTILIFSMMQLIYILNFIMREYRITTTFFWHSEGVGYMQTVASALYPFYFTTISKYVVDTELSLSTNTLISASVLYLLGISLMLISNNIKYEFRKNPLHPSLANLDSMPTFHGKKLLISNIWGVLRHPNYTGDIMIHVALALPGILTHQIMAAAPALLTIVVLIHRSWRDNARCKRRYGAAWQRYCKRVPSIIIPKVL